MITVTDINRDPSDLHPNFKGQVMRAVIALNEKLPAYKWALFEGLRHPDRQAHLLKIGSTQAGPWHSAHQYGLAADIVPANMSGWTWKVDPEVIRLFKVHAETLGLRVPIKWDPFHCESPDWPAVRKALRL